MNIIKVDSNVIDQVDEFIYELNNCPKYHIGFSPKNKAEIHSTVIDLLKDGNDFFAVYDEDRLIGVIGYENYDDIVEIWGPFILENNMHALNMLWDSMTSSVREGGFKYRIHCNIENQIVREFAINQGFKYICEGKAMELDLSKITIPAYDSISKIEKSDYVEFENLHTITFPNAYYNSKQIIELLGDENMCFVAKEDNKLVGYIFITMNLEFDEGNIDFIGVNSDYRGHGYGEKLLCTALNAFRQAGITNLHLWVNKVNDNAIKLYTKVGFKTIDNLIAFEK